MPSDIPTNVNQVEQLHAWTSTILNHLFPALQVLEEPGRAQSVIASAPFFLDLPDPPEWRLITRSSIPLNSAWQRGSSGIWVHARNLNTGNMAIPDEFKQA